MVDDNTKDNPVVQPGWLLVVQLLGAFRALVDDAHRLLAERGHADARPVHGFALQAVGSGATASQIAGRLGVSKQAAAKTIALLEAQGYVARRADPADARRKTVVPTARGRAFLAASARAFDEVVDRWRREVGERPVADLQRALDRLGVVGSAKLDLGTWST